ncbi:MAG: IS66 family transposase, partial [Acidimicrobiales bacterium]
MGRFTWPQVGRVNWPLTSHTSNLLGVLPSFKGVLVSDRYKTYWSIDGIEHALCLAHL